MENEIQRSLALIEETGLNNAAALEAQGAVLQTVSRRLAEIVTLLTPDEGRRDGVPLDELLAHLIRQNTEQLAVARSLLEAVGRLEANLPAQVAGALTAKGRPEGTFK